MCLTVSNRDHQVMSSGDTSVVPSSKTSSDTNQLPPSNLTQPTKIEINSSAADKANLKTSVSDFDLQENSMMPSNSVHSDSFENMGPEVRSLEAEEVGEILKRENAKSAFEITSFRPATDDLDKSVAGRPVSTDSLTLHTVMEKGESEETVVTPTKKQLSDTRTGASSPTSSSTKVDRENPVNELLDVNNEVTQANVTLSPRMVPPIPEESTVKSSALPPGGVAAQQGNGAGVQPNRFRRVNQYERGRWTIRDSLVTEEQAEARQSSVHSTKHQDIGEFSNGSTPPLKAAQQRFDSTASSVDPSTQQQNPLELNPLSGITGGGLAPDSTSDKDSSSIHMDRSSTAAETLSRNTSMSSIVALEKSVDGDEILRDIDADSMSGIATNQNPPLDQETVEAPLVPPLVSPQPPLLQTSSAGAVPPPTTTVVSREEQPGAQAVGVASAVGAISAPSTGTALEDVDLRRVEHAMSFLQNELKQVLTSSSYPMLMEENRALKDERTQMDQTNSRLKNELSETRDELQTTKEDLVTMREENARLKKELKELRSNLTRLALVPEVPTESGSSPQPGHTEDSSSIPPTSNDETSNSSNSSRDVFT